MAYTITFDSNATGVANPDQITVESGGVYGKLPTPTRLDYTFIGWWTSASDGDVVREYTPVTISDDQTLYAHWDQAPVTITFNANGGTCGTATLDVGSGVAIGDLPPATRTGYLFIGWYQADDYGWDLITPKNGFTSNKTVTARWVKEAPTGEELSYYYPGSSVSEMSTGLKFQYNTDGTAYTLSFISAGSYNNADFEGDAIIPYVTRFNNRTYVVVAVGIRFETYNQYSPNNNLTGVTCPVTVTTLHEYAFCYCTACILFNAIGIERTHFISLSKLDNILIIRLPLTSVSEECFTYCAQLTSLHLPRLEMCQRSIMLTNLSSVSLPSLINATALCSFESNITAISLPNVTYIKGIFQGCTADTIRVYMWQQKVSIQNMFVLPKAICLRKPSSGVPGMTLEDDDGNVISYNSENPPSTIKLGGLQNIPLEWYDDTNQELEFTVSFDVQSGTGTVSDKTAHYGYDMPVITTLPTRINYLFDGFYTDPQGMGLKYYNEDGTSARKWDWLENKTLYAKWLSDTFIVGFNANAEGVTVEPSEKTVKYGTAYGELPVPTRSDYVFAGWWTEADGGTEVTSETIFSMREDQVLYAKWVTAIVTFDANAEGFVAVPASKYVNNGEPYGELADVDPSTRTGYTFDGWWTYSWGGARILPTTIVEITEDQTLYAKWVPTPYTVELDKQSGTGGTTVVTANYGVALPTISIPSRAGYTFGGYYTAEDGGGTQYYDQFGNGLLAWNTTAGGTLYAKWTAVTYSVTISGGDGGTAGTGGTYTINVSSDQTITIVLPIRSNYRIKSWSFSGYVGEEPTIDEDADPNTTMTIPAGTYGDITATPTWEEITYTITLNAGTSATTPGTESVTVAQGGSLPAIEIPTTTGETFDGYYLVLTGTPPVKYYDATGSGVRAWELAEDRTLRAIWLPTQFSATIKTGYDEENDTSISFQYTDDPQTKTITEPTRTGYKITGWSFTAVDGNFAGLPSIAEDVLYIPAKTATNFIATPRWMRDLTYRIDFNANEGAGTMSSQTVVYGSRTNLEKNTFTKDGYVFRCWNTDAHGEGNSFSDGADCSWLTEDDLTPPSGEGLPYKVLYAMWRNADDGGKAKVRAGSRSRVSPSANTTIANVPNQTFNRTYGGITYTFHFRTFNRMMYADISVNGVSVANGVRCVGGAWLVPNEATEAVGGGNFRFRTLGDAYPWYEDFGETCWLDYFNSEAYAQARAEEKGGR